MEKSEHKFKSDDEKINEINNKKQLTFQELLAQQNGAVIKGVGNKIKNLIKYKNLKGDDVDKLYMS